MHDEADPAPCLFEVHHGSTIIRIADDWSGHVLIEQIYDGLRHARRSRDAGPAALSAPGNEVAGAAIEAALFHGFKFDDETSTYRASVEQIVALAAAAREQGREEALRLVKAQDSGSAG